MQHFRLAQLLCSRLCHDLITPVGAVATGLDIFQTSSDEADRQQILKLVSQSAQTSERRLVFYRAAFGFSSRIQLNSAEGLSKVLETFLEPLSLKFLWAPRPEEKDFQEIPVLETGVWGRVLLNLILVLTERVPYGGILSVRSVLEEDFLMTVVQISGNLVKERPQTAQALSGRLEEKDLTPQNSQPYLAYQLLKDAHMTLNFKETSPDCLEVTLCCPRGKESASPFY